MDAKNDVQEGDLVDLEDDSAIADGSKNMERLRAGPPVVPKLFMAKLQMPGIFSMAPSNKKLDERWDEMNIFSSLLEDALPNWPR